jgi:hypothetical protein
MVKLIALLLFALFAHLPLTAEAVQDIIVTSGTTTLSRLGKVSIDVHGKGCKQITNKFHTSDDLFIPYGTKAEWESFLDFADSTNNIDVAPCPIAYGAWTYSGSCSATCGGGTIVQTRSCVYTPTGQALDCSYCGGECSQTVECNTTACAAWDRSCAAPAWNPSNNPATCGQNCTVTCMRDGVAVAGSNCTDTPPADYLASNSCSGCAPNSTTQAVTTVSCSKGGISGSGTIDVRRDIDCNGVPIAGTGHWVATSGCCIPNLPANQTQQRDSVSIPGCASVTNSCTTPWGSSVAHGSSVPAYPNATVPFGQTCQSQTRICNNGVLSGTATNQNCTVSDSCPAGSETTGSHTATCAQGGMVGSGTIYVDDMRDCKGNIIPGRGTWTGVTGCCIAGLPNNQTQNKFGINVAGCDATCSGTHIQQNTAACSVGGLSGNGTIYANVQVDCDGNKVPGTGYWTSTPGCCVPGLVNTQTETRFGLAVRGCDAPPPACTCKPAQCEGPNLVSRDSCTNRWEDGCGVQWNHASCAPQNQSCTTPWGATVAHGASTPAYATATVPFGQTCQPQTRVCNNGNLSGSYTNRTCTVDQPASCTKPWGGALAHGQSVTAYAASSVPSGSSCSSQTRTCNNGTLSGTYGYSTCSTSTPACSWKIARKDKIPGRTCNNPPTTGKGCSCGETDVFDYANCTVHMSCSAK